MTRFVLGMVAAGLWIAATTALILLTRNTPAPPQKSIRSFRRARRRLAPRRNGAKLMLQEDLQLAAPLTEPGPSPPPVMQAHPLDTVEEIPVVAADPSQASPAPPPPPPEQEATDTEMAEIAAVLEAVTDESVVAKRHRLAPPSDRRPSRGPRKVGRVTYVLVDDEGKPLD